MPVYGIRDGIRGENYYKQGQERKRVVRGH